MFGDDTYSEIRCTKTGKILKPYGVTITTLRNNKMSEKGIGKKNMKTQFGVMTTGDLDDNTMTFKIKGEMILGAGKFAIVPIEDYKKPKIGRMPIWAMVAIGLLISFSVNTICDNYFNGERLEKEETLLRLKKHNLSMKLEISVIDLDIIEKEIWILKNK